MTNQDHDDLNFAFLRNLASKWWIILLFMFSGAMINFDWRKDLPQKQRIEANVVTTISSEIFKYFADSAEDIQITMTNSGQFMLKLVVQADSDVEARFKKWVDQTNLHANNIIGDAASLLVTYRDKLQKRFELDCKNKMTASTHQAVALCLDIENHLVDTKLRIIREDAMVRIISIKPFSIQPTSLPVRDMLFGAFIGLVLSLMILSFFIQIRLAKNRR